MSCCFSIGLLNHQPEQLDTGFIFLKILFVHAHTHLVDYRLIVFVHHPSFAKTKHCPLELDLIARKSTISNGCLIKLLKGEVAWLNYQRDFYHSYLGSWQPLRGYEWMGQNFGQIINPLDAFCFFPLYDSTDLHCEMDEYTHMDTHAHNLLIMEHVSFKTCKGQATAWFIRGSRGDPRRCWGKHLRRLWGCRPRKPVEPRPWDSNLPEPPTFVI